MCLVQILLHKNMHSHSCSFLQNDCHFCENIYKLLLVAMATPETSKQKTGVYIVHTPASRVMNLPEALGSYFQPIHFMSIVYFILKFLLMFHTFCVEQLLSTLHASLSHSMCMCHLVMSWQSMLMTSHD